MRAAQAHTSTGALLDAVDPLPESVRSRLRAALLSASTDVDLALLIAEVADAAAWRSPTGDDLALVDRVVSQCEDDEYGPAWLDALGPVPIAAVVEAALAAGGLEERWVRAHQWLALCPDEVGHSWAEARALMRARYGDLHREVLATRCRVEAGRVESPIPVSELRRLPPLVAARRVAAWRPGPTDWSMSAWELARTLDTLVEARPEEWLRDPLTIGAELRHPMYIEHYLRRTGDVCKRTPDLVNVGGVLDLIALVRTHPWEPLPLGSLGPGNDSWSRAEQAAVDLLRAMANAKTGFAGRDDDVWELLRTETLKRPEATEPPEDLERIMTRAMSRPGAQALEAALSFIWYELETHDTVRGEVLELLTEVLQVDGEPGAEYRAVLARRIDFLRYVAEPWVDDHAALLFGDDAPDALGQLSIDLAL